MKILLISPTQSGIGGIAQHVKGLTKFLKTENHTVEIISSENTFTIPIKGLKNPSFMISSFLKSKFKKNFDIVHAHNIPAALAMKNSSGKKILTIHGVYSQQIRKLHNETISKISNTFENDALNWADIITVVSKDAYDYYTKLGYSVQYIPNAIDIKSLSKIEDKQYEKQIIFAGRLSSEKGIDTLCKIAETISEKIHLIILGSGPEENKIKNISRSNVHYLGYQTKDRTIELIRGSDILIQPSIMEGISSTILEAMACKTLVIATNIGGTKDIIKNNKTGILIDKNSSHEILKKIDEVFNETLDKKSIIENAFVDVQNYDWSKIIQMYLNLYQKKSN